MKDYALKVYIMFFMFAILRCFGWQMNYCSAQNVELKFEHLSVEDGLSQNSVYSIFQDHTGFMWFGTRTGGLNRFDGYSFITYKNNTLDSFSISGNEILALHEDKQGFLWVGTRNEGLNRFDPVNNRFYRYVKSKDSTSISSKIINCIIDDSDGNLWFGTNYGLCTYNSETDNFVRHDEMSEFSEIQIKVLKIAGDSLLWIGSKTGLYLYNTSTRKIIKYYEHSDDNPGSLSDSYISSLIIDEKERLWVGTYRHGLNRLDDPEKGVFTRFMHNDKVNTSISSDIIRTLHQDRKGVIWIGTKMALEQLMPEEQDKFNPVFVHHLKDESNPSSISQNSIFSFYEDQQDNLWVGTYIGGVNHVYNGPQKFKHIRHNVFKPGSLSNNVVSSFCENDMGFWVGTEGGGLNLYDAKAGVFKVYQMNSDDPDALQSDHIKSLYVDSDGDLWIGTFNGLHLFNEDLNSFKQFFKGVNISSIIEGRKGELWVGNESNVLKIRKSDLSYVKYEWCDLAEGQFRMEDINIVFKDSKDRIWVGAKVGLYLFDREKDRFTGFFHESNNPYSLSNNIVSCINEDLEGNVWFGTTDGLNVFDDENYRFLNFNEKAGLPDNVITNLVFDEKGLLWITTNKGLTRLDPKRLLQQDTVVNNVDKTFVRNFDVADGLQNTQFTQNSSYKNSKGQIYLGGMNGFNVFHPDSVIDNVHKPNVVITEFKLFNKPVSFNSKNSPLTKPIWLTQRIVLNHKQSMLTFGFAALSYFSSVKNQYAYKLIGYDKDWNFVGSKHEATYTSLPAGDYEFCVIASNNDGQWNTDGVSLQLRIAPPFWERWWFRVGIVSLILYLIYVYYSQRLLKAKKINRTLEEKVRERTSLLREKNDLLLKQSNDLSDVNAVLVERQQLIEEQSEELTTQRNELAAANEVKDKLFSVVAHDLKGPLGAVLGLSELLAAEYNSYDEKARIKYANSIFKSSQIVYDLIMSLLDWSRSQMGNIIPSFERRNINTIIDECLRLAIVQAESKNIKIVRDLVDEKIWVNLDENLISTVIRNLISNAIKFTHEDGEIVVSCIKDADKVIVKICDNGVGIEKPILSELFRRSVHYITYGTNNETGTGLGLKICYEFIKLHNGEIWAESEFGKGSEFCFSLPVGMRQETR
jgi:signal transduction histidine kinase/ligand-binding sensor domain-containing protein